MADSEPAPHRCAANSSCACTASPSWKTWLSSWRSGSAPSPGELPFLWPGALPATCCPTDVYVTCLQHQVPKALGARPHQEAAGDTAVLARDR